MRRGCTSASACRRPASGWGRAPGSRSPAPATASNVPDAALNYVWDNRHPVGTEAPNAYTERTRMIVLRSNEAATGRWQEERRDIATDAATAFGGKGVELTLLAVATDTDNTGERARAGFADLHFVARGAQCRFPPDHP